MAASTSFSLIPRSSINADDDAALIAAADLAEKQHQQHLSQQQQNTMANQVGLAACARLSRELLHLFTCLFSAVAV